MNSFLSLLATFYVCDAMMAEGDLNNVDEIRCAATFETLKISFLTDEERQSLREIGYMRGGQTREAYLRFQDWELDNADLVALFREEARTAIVGMR